MPEELPARQGMIPLPDSESIQLRNDLRAALDKVVPEGDPMDTWLGPLAALLIARWAGYDESEREAVAAANGQPFAPELPEALRLPAWDGPVSAQADAVAESLRGMDALVRTGSNVARYLAPVTPLIVRALENSQSMFMELLAWVRRLELGTPQGRALAARLFDDILFEAVKKQGKLLGEFITPRTVIDFMLELAKPEAGERIYDPCFGYGGILIEAARKFSSNSRTGGRSDGVHARRPDVFGIEINRFSFAIGVCRAFLAGINDPALELCDALERPLPRNRSSEGFDCILAVPPWGQRHNTQNPAESPYPFRSKRYENLFLQHVMGNLRPGGRAVVAVPDSVLFRSGPDHQVRKELLSDYSVDAVVSLPAGAFAPHTGIHVNLIVFRRQNPASEIRFLDVSRQAWKAVSSGGGLGRAGQHVSGSSCRKLAQAVYSGSEVPVTSGIKVWNVSVRELASRSHDLVVMESGTETLNWKLDRLTTENPLLKVEELEHIAEVYRGRSYKRRFTTETHNIPDVVAGLLRVGDVKRETIRVPSLFLTDGGKNRLKDDELLRSGDVVIAIRGAIGKTGVIRNDVESVVESIATGSLAVIRADEGIKPEFLSAILRSPMYQNWMVRNARGNTVQQLSLNSLCKLRIPVPRVQVQDKVLSEISDSSHTTSVTSGRRIYYGELDAMTTLAEVLSGTPKDPIAVWLEQPHVVALASERDLDSRDPWSMLLACSKLLSELDFSLSDFELPSEIDPLTCLGVSEAKYAYWEMILGSQVPRGVGRLFVLERVLGHLKLAQRELENAYGPYNERLSKFIDRMFSLAGRETERMRASVRIDISLEPSEVAVGVDSEVQLRLTNSSIVPLLALQVSTKPAVGEKTIPYLDAGESHNIPLIVHPRDANHRLDMVVSWKARHLGFELNVVEDEKMVSLRVSSFPEAVCSGDMGASPYIVGNPVVRQEMFFGRDDVMDRIRRQLGEQANVILLEGNRRTGKTSILKQFGKTDVLPGWIPVYCSFQDAEGDDRSGGITTRNVFRLLARATGWALYDAGVETWFPDLPDRDPARPFKLAFRTALNQAFAGDHSFETFELYIEAALQAARPRRVLLMLDEFDKLQEGIDAGVTSPQVPENIRHLLQHQPGLSAIITGSRRLKRLREEYWSALFGFGYRIGVSALPMEDARRLVTEPVEGRLDYLPQARDRIVNLCARHPFLIQSLCNRVFEHAAAGIGRTITRDIVEGAATEMVEDNEHFRTLWDYAGNTRRRLLLAFCERLAEGPDPVNLDLLQVMLREKRVPFGGASDLADDIQELREIELIDLDERDRRPGYRLAVPLMAKWLRKHVDFDDLIVRARREALEAQP